VAYEMKQYLYSLNGIKREHCFTVESIGENKWRMSHGTIVTRN